MPNLFVATSEATPLFANGPPPQVIGRVHSHAIDPIETSKQAFRRWCAIVIPRLAPVSEVLVLVLVLPLPFAFLRPRYQLDRRRLPSRRGES